MQGRFCEDIATERYDEQKQQSRRAFAAECRQNGVLRYILKPFIVHNPLCVILNHMAQQSNSILTRLYSRTSKGIKLGLERMQHAAEALGNPQQAYHSIHVAGTNGKGSVCAYAEAILRAAGHRTGLYTSPHILRFEERFLIDGKPVHEQVWLDIYRDIEWLVNKYDLTFFEISTLIAFELFKREKVTWAVFEVGLGGRLDATNVVHPDICVIAAIGIDHTEYLGPDVVSIAREKLGIVKAGVPLVMQESPVPDVLDTAVATCAALHAPLTIARRDEISNVVRDAHKTRFTVHGKEYRVGLRGIYQPLNALCALKTMYILECAREQDIQQGLLHATLPGRFSIVHDQGKTLVFDVGHNLQAMQGMVQSLDETFGTQSVGFVVGIMKDKDTAGMMAVIARRASSIICTKPATDRAADAGYLQSLVPAHFDGQLKIIQNVAAAIQHVRENDDKIICITGSFYTVGEAMAAWGLEPYSSK